MATGMSMKPAPWSIGPEPSPSSDGLAVSTRAFRIWTAEAAGALSRRRAAAPATVGEAKEVPASKLSGAGIKPARHALRSDTRSRARQVPWTKLATPFATTSGLILPSAVGPLELNGAEIGRAHV